MPDTKPPVVEESTPETAQAGEPACAAADLKPILYKAPYNPEDEEELHCECSNPAHQHR